MEKPQAPKIVLDLIEAAKSAVGVTTENALAVRLGWRRQLLNHYKFGTKPNNEHLLTLCETAGWDFYKTLIEVEHAFAESEEAKRRWDNCFKQLGGIAASFFLGVVFVLNLAAEKAAELALLSP